MDEYHQIPENLWRFCKYPFRSLPPVAKVWFSLFLNPEKQTFGPEHGNLQDWRGVAEELGCTSMQVDNYQRAVDPLAEVMKNFPIIKQDATIGDFLLAILRCERHDVLGDPELLAKLARCKIPSVVQVQPVEQDPQIDSCSDATNQTVTQGEVDSGEREYFNAYVCHVSSDLSFVKNMIEELEVKGQLKLCIPDRDLLLGSAKYEVMTKLIQERCNRLIAVLSPDFMKSEECHFLLHFALSLNPSARGKKLIPIVYKPCDIPPVLNHITLVDYTRSDVIEWFWSRLSKSLRPSAIYATSNPPTYISKNTTLTPCPPIDTGSVDNGEAMDTREQDEFIIITDRSHSSNNFTNSTTFSKSPFMLTKFFKGPRF